MGPHVLGLRVAALEAETKAACAAGCSPMPLAYPMLTGTSRSRPNARHVELQNSTTGSRATEGDSLSSRTYLQPCPGSSASSGLGVVSEVIRAAVNPYSWVVGKGGVGCHCS